MGDATANHVFAGSLAAFLAVRAYYTRVNRGYFKGTTTHRVRAT